MELMFCFMLSNFKPKMTTTKNLWHITKMPLRDVSIFWSNKDLYKYTKHHLKTAVITIIQTWDDLAEKFKNSTHFRETNPITKFHILSTAIEKNSFSLCVNVCVIIMFLRHLYRWKQKKADLTFSDGSGIPEIQVSGWVITLNFRFREPDPSLLHFLKHCLTYKKKYIIFEYKRKNDM